MRQPRFSILPSALCPLPSRSGFTLIEMLTSVAVLIIVLGLMVSLARYVRDRSAQQLTRNLLHQLDVLMAQYMEENDKRLPPVTTVIPDEPLIADEAILQSRARLNNEDFVRALRSEIARTWMRPVAARGDVPAPPAEATTGPPAGSRRRGVGGVAAGEQRFGELPLSVYDEVTLRDAWGSLIVFMPREHRAIGMAPRARSFFFSAGPDRKYLTRDDNLYSYETGIAPER